jgi:RNA polymerase sigma factor (TIGR02999 family)
MSTPHGENTPPASDRDPREDLAAELLRVLRRLASAQLRRDKLRSAFDPSEIASEAFLKLARASGDRPIDRTKTLATAAAVIRNLLVDHARARSTAKRGGHWKRIELSDDLMGAEGGREIDLVDLDDALKELAELDARQARIVELRCFAGLSIKEIAAVLGLAPRSVDADWAMARAWLARHLQAGHE